MVNRRGLGKGQGKGYKNIIGKDPTVHSQSAKGIKQPQRMKSLKSRLSDEEKEAYDELGFTRFRTLNKYLKSEGWNIEDFREEESGVYRIDCGGAEFLLFANEDKAEQYAKDMVYDMLENEPELFNQEFLERHMEITDTDRRIIANDEADMVDEMDKYEILDMTGTKEEYNEYEVDIDETGDEIDDLEKQQFDDTKSEEEQEQIMDEIEVLEDKKEELEQKQEDLFNRAKEEAREMRADEVYEKLADPVQYFVNELGAYSKEELLKQNFIRINTEEASEEAVSDDGWEHFVAKYDGDSVELPYVEKGVTERMVMARVN